MEANRPLLVGSLILNGALLVCVMVLALRQPAPSPFDQIMRDTMASTQAMMNDPDFRESLREPKPSVAAAPADDVPSSE